MSFSHNLPKVAATVVVVFVAMPLMASVPPGPTSVVLISGSDGDTYHTHAPYATAVRDFLKGTSAKDVLVLGDTDCDDWALFLEAWTDPADPPGMVDRDPLALLFSPPPTVDSPPLAVFCVPPPTANPPHRIVNSPIRSRTNAEARPIHLVCAVDLPDCDVLASISPVQADLEINWCRVAPYYGDRAPQIATAASPIVVNLDAPVEGDVVRRIGYRSQPNVNHPVGIEHTLCGVDFKSRAEAQPAHQVDQRQVVGLLTDLDIPVAHPADYDTPRAAYGRIGQGTTDEYPGVGAQVAADQDIPLQVSLHIARRPEPYERF